MDPRGALLFKAVGFCCAVCVLFKWFTSLPVPAFLPCVQQSRAVAGRTPWRRCRGRSPCPLPLPRAMLEVTAGLAGSQVRCPNSRRGPEIQKRRLMPTSIAPELLFSGSGAALSCHSMGLRARGTAGQPVSADSGSPKTLESLSPIHFASFALPGGRGAALGFALHPTGHRAEGLREPADHPPQVPAGAVLRAEESPPARPPPDSVPRGQPVRGPAGTSVPGDGLGPQLALQPPLAGQRARGERRERPEPALLGSAARWPGARPALTCSCCPQPWDVGFTEVAVIRVLNTSESVSCSPASAITLSKGGFSHQRLLEIPPVLGSVREQRGLTVVSGRVQDHPTVVTFPAKTQRHRHSVAPADVLCALGFA